MTGEMGYQERLALQGDEITRLRAENEKLNNLYNHALDSLNAASDRTQALKAERDGLAAHYQNGNRAVSVSREDLGRIVREVWVKYAESKPNPPAHHLTPWESLDYDNKEVDRLIGERVARIVLIADAASTVFTDPAAILAAHDAEVRKPLEAERERLVLALEEISKIVCGDSNWNHLTHDQKLAICAIIDKKMEPEGENLNVIVEMHDAEKDAEIKRLEDLIYYANEWIHDTKVICNLSPAWYQEVEAIAKRREKSNQPPPPKVADR